MTETAGKSLNVTYQALALMSRLFYEKFGDDAIPIIRDVWYKIGLDSGEQSKKTLSTHNFKSAARLLLEIVKRKGAKGTGIISDRFYHFTTQSGEKCFVGLENAGRPICEAVNSVYQGQFKSMCGCDVEMNIVSSRATGDDCCEIIFRTKDIPNE